jgi:hypothetical protein
MLTDTFDRWIVADFMTEGVLSLLDKVTRVVHGPDSNGTIPRAGHKTSGRQSSLHAVDDLVMSLGLLKMGIVTARLLSRRNSGIPLPDAASAFNI